MLLHSLLPLSPHPPSLSPPHLNQTSVFHFPFSTHLHSNCSFSPPYYLTSAHFRGPIRARKNGQLPTYSAVKEEEEKEEEEEEEEEERKSKTQRKREARHAVDRGVQLAALTVPQLRQVIKWGGLSEEVFEAVMLVKKLGLETKNGRRRQFNFIGGLLRDVDDDLMENAIKASKDGNLEGIFAESIPVDKFDPLEETTEYEERGHFKEISERWLHGLVLGDCRIEDEVYSIRSEDFDRQELRRLIKAVQLEESSTEGNAIKARKAMSKFLRDLAKASFSEAR